MATKHGRPPEREPPHEAGRAILAWSARQSKAKPLERLALDIGVDVRTLRRWIYGDAVPDVQQAILVYAYTLVDVYSWELDRASLHAKRPKPRLEILPTDSDSKESVHAADSCSDS